MFWLNQNFNHLDFPYNVPREDIVHQLCIPIAAIIYHQIFDILKISWYLHIRSNMILTFESLAIHLQAPFSKNLLLSTMQFHIHEPRLGSWVESRKSSPLIYLVYHT